MLEQTNIITTSTLICVLASIWSTSPSSWYHEHHHYICEMNSSGCACLGAVFTRALMLTSRACAFLAQAMSTLWSHHLLDMVYFAFSRYHGYQKVIIILKINSSGCACQGAVFTRALMLTSRACAFWRKPRRTLSTHHHQVTAWRHDLWSRRHWDVCVHKSSALSMSWAMSCQSLSYQHP